MIAAIENWWTALSARERILVGVAGAVTLIMLGWFIAGAMLGALDAQAERHREAVARAARMETKAELLASTASASNAASMNGSLDQWLSQSANESGLTLDRNDPRGDRMANVAVAGVRPPALVSWLATLEQQGLVLDRLTLLPATDGTIALVADVRRP